MRDLSRRLLYTCAKGVCRSLYHRYVDKQTAVSAKYYLEYLALTVVRIHVDINGNQGYSRFIPTTRAKCESREVSS